MFYCLQFDCLQALLRTHKIFRDEISHLSIYVTYRSIVYMYYCLIQIARLLACTILCFKNSVLKYKFSALETRVLYFKINSVLKYTFFALEI